MTESDRDKIILETLQRLSTPDELPLADSQRVTKIQSLTDSLTELELDHTKILRPKNTHQHIQSDK